MVCRAETYLELGRGTDGLAFGLALEGGIFGADADADAGIDVEEADEDVEKQE